jgi:hypothetical protein
MEDEVKNQPVEPDKVESKEKISPKKFIRAIGGKLILITKPKVYIPAIALVLLLGASLAYLNLHPINPPPAKNPWGKISALIINAANAQDNFTATATISDSLGIGADSAFIIKSKEAIDEKTLQASITLTPAADFSLAKIDNNTYKILPRQILQGKKVYNLKIASAFVDSSGVTQERDYSWAFQVKDIFKVLNSIPADKATAVPLNAGIEVTFSNENFLNYEQAFKIEPAVKGHFEIHKRTLVFVPDKLDAGVIYKVTIDKDILQVKDSDSKLAQNFVIQFETDPAGKLRGEYSEFNFQDNFNEVYSERAPALGVNLYNINLDKFPVEVYAFAGVDDFIAALDKSQQVPYWAQYNRTTYNTDVAKLKKVSTFSVPLSPYGYNKYLVFPDKLPKGFYVAQVNVNGVLIQTFVEVSDLTDYSTVTENNTLVWLNNIKTKAPVAGAKVEVIGTDKQTVTGADGTAVLPTAWLSAATTSDHIYLLIDAGEKTIVPLSFNYQNYAPAGIAPFSSASDYWYYFYTDRLTYQVGDTASYWGYLKPREGTAASSQVTIKLFSWQNYYDYYNDPIPLLTATSTLDANFTFTGKISFGRLSAGYYNLQYFIDDKMIGSRGISIEDYKKPAYKLDAVPSKLALFAGDEQTVKVTASFFEGTAVPNLSLNNSFDNTASQTDAQGNISKTFITPAVSGDYGSNCTYFTPTAAEEADISANACYTVFNYHIVPQGEIDKSGDNQEKLQLNVKKVDIAAANVSGATEDKFLHEAAPNLPVKLTLTEISYVAEETGNYYDFIDKVVRKTYNYNEVDKIIATYSGVTDASGHFEYAFPVKKDRGYRADVTVKDTNGQEVTERYDIYFSPYNLDEQSDNYNLQFKDQAVTQFSVGDPVNIQYFNKSTLLPAASGHFLYYRLFKGLVDYQIASTSEYDFNFEERFLPGVYVMGVYFDGETYHRPDSGYYWSGMASGLYVPFKKTDRELKVEVTPDQKKYQPAGVVKLKIKVTSQTGFPMAAAVNLNLVDEAYYAVFPESVDAISGLYNNQVDAGELTTYISNPMPQVGSQGAERGGCFLGGTKITLADHSTKNIEDLKIGDEVLTFTDETAKSYAPEKVTQTFAHEVNEYLVINDKLKITPIHRVFLNGQWQMIGAAKVGDWLLGENGEKIKITKIEDKRGTFKVYNLTVEPYHTFFAEGFYVHNQKGGGVRSLFVDTAEFINLTTGADGTATADFKLPDNITSWRVTAQAFGGDLYAGDAVIDLPSSLPAFVTTAFAKEYLTVDKPEVKVRAYGDALKDNQKVQFKMDAPDLNFSAATSGVAFAATYFALPPLTLGEHAITTSLVAGVYKDAMLEKINVLDTRFKETKTNFYDLVENLKPAGADSGLTDLIFSDKNQGRFYNQLSYCYFCTDGDRVDQKLTRVLSSALIEQYFGEKNNNTENFSGAMYQTDDGGIALLPYAGSDFELSAKVAFIAGAYFDKVRLTDYFYKILSADDSTQEQVGVAIFALAGLGEPVLQQAENFAALPNLTDKDKLYIGIALNHLGDAETARNIYYAVMKDKGETFDPYLRVKISDSQDDILAATSLAAILAGGLGIADHEKLWNYVQDNYTQDILIDLEKLIYVSETLPKLIPGDSSFTVNLPTGALNKTLSRGNTFHLAVTAADLASISFTNIKGQIGLESIYQAPEANIAPIDTSYVALRRAYFVNGVQTNNLRENDQIEVRIYPYFKAAAPDTAYQITDLLPSGLALLTDTYSRGGNYSCTDYYPYDAGGQTVKFMLWKNWNSNPNCPRDYFSYHAHVVNAGEYKAEPAVIQSMSAATVKNYTAPDIVVIVN